MTLIQEPDVRPVPVQVPRGRLPEVSSPVVAAPPAKRSGWRRVVLGTTLGLAGVGVGVSLGLGVVNTNDVDSLQSDVASLQSELGSAQTQVHAVRMDMIDQRSGYGLAHEHLAQAPVDREHMAQAR